MDQGTGVYYGHPLDAEARRLLKSIGGDEYFKNLQQRYPVKSDDASAILTGESEKRDV